MVPNYLSLRLAPPRNTILHLGVGGFHRSHAAMYTHKLLQTGQSDWAICGAGLRPEDAAMQSALKTQDYLYTLTTKCSEGNRSEIIGSILDYQLGTGENGARSLVQRTNQDDVKIVSLTVTEKGYNCNFETGQLNRKNPDVQHDLLMEGAPKTAIGFLAEGLKMKRRENRKPFTVMSCDNLPSNGHVTQKAVLNLFEEVDRDLYHWTKENVCFPNSMVDRITPACSLKDRLDIEEHFSYRDEVPVVAEEFCQWVIEDNFSQSRPDWDKVDVFFVDDVLPYELMKLRLLNGGHSALVYVAHALGFTEVDEAMNHPLINRYVRGYMDEVTSSIPTVPGIDLEEYKATLIARFSNSAIKDTVARITEDGSTKLLSYVIPALFDVKDSNGGRNMKYMGIFLAFWVHFCRGVTKGGIEFNYKDPKADILRPLARESGKDLTPFLREVFEDLLDQHPDFVSMIKKNLETIDVIGEQAAFEQLMTGSGESVV